GSDIRDDRPDLMAALRCWAPRKKLSDRAGHRSASDFGLFHWAALWAEGCRNRLFDCNDAVGNSASYLVPTRNCHFAVRPAFGNKPSILLGHCGCRRCVCCSRSTWTVGFATGETNPRGWRNAQHLLLDTSVRHGAKRVLFGSRCYAQETLTT